MGTLGRILVNNQRTVYFNENIIQDIFRIGLVTLTTHFMNIWLLD